MDFLLDALTDWLKEMLVGGIMSNLSGMFDSVNQQVADIATQVGQTPQGWNGSIFSMIQNLSNSIMVPIAGVILAIVMTLELIQMITDKNNLHDVDTWMIFKWVFKSAAAILIVSNTWNIVMGVFDAAQSVVAQAAGIIGSDASIDISSVMTDIESRLMDMDLGPLFGLWFQSLFIGITMWALYICIFIVIYGRMIEIYLVTSVAPIPMATMVNREWGQMGQNYLRTLFSLGFQAFLIVVCVAIYSVLVQNISVSGDISAAIWTCQVIPMFAIYTFGPQIVGLLGLGVGKNAALGNVVISLFFMLGCIPPMLWLNTAGRRPLLIGSFAMMTLALAVLGLIPDMGIWLVVMAFAVYAFFSGGPGNLQWLYPNELFPTDIRASAVGVIMSLSRIGTIVSTWALPIFINNYGISNTMLMGAGISLFGLLISVAFAPETRGMSLAQTSNMTIRGQRMG